MYFASIMRPDDAAEVWGTGLTVSGDLSLAGLERALELLRARHEALRSAFQERGGDVFQVVPGLEQAATGPLIDVVEARGDSPDERQAWARAEARRLIEVPFDISTGPLWRTTVIRISPGLQLMVFVFHHLIIDDITMQIFAEELRVAYADPHAPGLAVPAVQYSDFQAAGKGLPVDPAGLDYWREQLADMSPPRLPEDGRETAEEDVAASLPVAWPGPAMADFEAFCRDRSVTPFTGLLAVYFILLRRWAGADDVSVGTPVLSRPHSTLFRTIGFFANTVVLRSPAAPALTFDQFLARVHETVQDALDYQDVPFDVVVDALAPQRDLDRNPLFQAAIAYGTLDPAEVWALDGLRVTPVPELAEMSGVQFDLTLDIRPFAGELGIAVQYNRRRFSEETMLRFAEAYGSLLRALCRTPDVPIGSVPLLDRAALTETLTLGTSGTPLAATDCTSGWELFLRTAAAAPDREAVSADGERLTFAELTTRARRIAAGLRARGVQTGTLVGICLPRRADLIATMLATWCAGGGFLLLDPRQPEARRNLLVQEAGIGLLVTESEGNDGEELGDSHHPAAAPAYVVFTSGSTGKPKGVVVDQAGLVALATTQLAPMYARLPAGRQVNVGGLSSLSFDAFINQCLGMIAFGHRLVLIGDEERTDPHRLRARGSTPETALDVLDCSSSHLEILVEAGILDSPNPPRIVVIGGEGASDRLWQRLHDQPGLLAFNTYGVTECTVESTMVEIGDHPRQVAGRAAGTSRIYVVDDQLHLLPPMFIGEICIGGIGVAQGYVGQPGYTSERFLADPFSPVPGQRMYRTGDKGRLRPDGQLEFWGRIDDQVKVRGLRVEPGELEAALGAHPAIARAAVIATDAGTRRAQLVAYIVPGDGGREGLTSSAVREFLRGTLPSALLPDRVVVLDSLPITPNGKLDRKALAAVEPPAGEPSAVRGVSVPADSREGQLCRIVAEVVGVPRADLTDNFFLLGGNSLLAMQITSRVRTALGCELSIRAIFEAQSIGEMAAQLTVAASDGSPRPTLRRREVITSGPQGGAMDWLLARLREQAGAEAMVGHCGDVTYAELAGRTDAWLTELDRLGVGGAEIVAVVGNASPAVVALFTALAVRGGVVVPFAPADPPREQREIRMATAHATRVVEFTGPDEWSIRTLAPPDGPRPGLLTQLCETGEAGLVLFSSGSTGESKAALLSLPRLLGGFRAASRPRRTLQFMALDHIGGVNTLFRTLVGGGTVVTEPQRTPKHACEAIERHRVQVLPTTPTFLNMLLLSGAHRDYDLSSLELITYGTEPMRAVTLAHAAEVFPDVQFKQTYGLTETGILPTRSVSSDSLRMDVGGHGFRTSIRDGVLWIKSPSSMLGYLNAPSPFDQDGWLNTADAVEVAEDGSLRVLGRLSALVNVGGEKVSPAEVEDVLLRAGNVRDVVVTGRPNAVTGMILVASVELVTAEERRALTRRLRQFCAEHLPPHKIPAVVTVSEVPLHGERFKRMGGTA